MASSAKSREKNTFVKPKTTNVRQENLSEDQRTLLDLILSEDVEQVREFFVSHRNFGMNLDRSFTRGAITVSIDSNRDDILGILLRNKFKVGGALFTAVREGSKECVVQLLAFMSREEGDKGPEDIRQGTFMSPLMLAVHLEQFEIIEYLVNEGYKIKEPSDEEEGIELPLTRSGSCIFGGETVEYNHAASVTDTMERKSQQRQVLLRINAYQALANPLYIGYSFLHDDQHVHPMFRIFQLNDQLTHLGIVDIEFKMEYHKISKTCERFAVDLMEQCRTVDEIEVLTNLLPEIVESFRKDHQYIEVRTAGAEELTVLNLAIRSNHDELVAHPYSQLRLNEVLYRNIYKLFSFEQTWRNRGYVSRFLFAIRHTMLLPFITMIHVLFPNSLVSRRMKNPVVKFISHTGSFIVFVLLLMLSSFQDKFSENIATPTITDWLILAWVTGLIVQEIKELHFQGSKRYADQWWNVLAVIMLALFAVSYTLQLIAYGISGEWDSLYSFKDITPSTWYKITLTSNSFFSLGMVFSFLHLSSAFQVNAVFGPMQLSLYRLIADVIKFLVFFFTIFIAFGFSLRRLYSHYISMQQHMVRAMAAGPTNTTKESDVGHKFSEVYNSLYSLFWSVFGLTELTTFETKDRNFKITTYTGEVLFGFYQVLIVIIAVNMLIAMMTRSFDDIADDADTQWKISRTKMWMTWVDKGSILPPPFNLIPNRTNIVRALSSVINGLTNFHHSVRCTCRRSQQSHITVKENGSPDEEISLKDLTLPELGSAGQESKRRQMLKRIVERYLHKRREESRQEDSEMLRDIKEIQEKLYKEMRLAFGMPLLSPLQRKRTPSIITE